MRITEMTPDALDVAAAAGSGVVPPEVLRGVESAQAGSRAITTANVPDDLAVACSLAA